MSILKNQSHNPCVTVRILWHGEAISYGTDRYPSTQNSAPDTGTFRIHRRAKLYTNLQRA